MHRKITLLILLLISLSNYLRAQMLTQSNLPIVIISTFGQPIPDEPKIPGTMKIIDNGSGAINHITDPGNVYDGNIGIEIRGHFSAILPQKPYAIETRDSLQNNLNVSLFGFPEEHDWVLLANYNDKVFMRNTLAFKLFNEMGHYASRTRYCEVTVNGVYQGIYIFGEKIKRDDGRVDISKLLENENTGDQLTGGYIFKQDYWDATNSWQSSYHPLDHPEMNIHFVYEYPDIDIITSTQKNYIKTYVNSFESALYGYNFKDPVFGYAPFINISSFIDYFIVNELSRNNDGFKKSVYFYKNRDSVDRRIQSGPVWDFDWAWKNIDECYIFRATNGSGWSYKVNDCYPDVSSPAWNIRLLQDPKYANELKCRYTFLRSNKLSEDSLFEYIDNTAAYLEQAQQRHYQRWPILGLNVGAPVVGPIPTTFQGEINGFKDWISLRLNWLDNNMPGICTTNSLEPEISAAPLLFPNPANETAFLETNLGSGLIGLRCTLSNGIPIEIPFENSNGTLILDLEHIPSGYYILNPVSNTDSNIHPVKLLVIH
ncbi:MAG: CotH kinase family protein [Bacteroidales bacterium]|nr:CotH kinase family protein [Bacteroidales bacterium]